MHALEIAEDEGVARLSLVVGPLGQPEVPEGVVIPGVLLEVGVLLGSARLRRSPVAVADVLADVDELASVGDGATVNAIAGHIPDSSRCWRTEPGQCSRIGNYVAL